MTDYNAIRNGIAGSTRPEYKTFTDLNQAISWVEERESGSIEEWETGVIVYSHFPRAKFV